MHRMDLRSGRTNLPPRPRNWTPPAQTAECPGREPIKKRGAALSAAPRSGSTVSSAESRPYDGNSDLARTSGDPGSDARDVARRACSNPGYRLEIPFRNGISFFTNAFLGAAEFGSLCEYVVCRSTSTRFRLGMPDWLARMLAAVSTRSPPSAAPNA